MDRLSKCVAFQSRIMLKGVLGFTLIFFAICLAIFLLLSYVVSTDKDVNVGMNSGFYFAAAIFTLVFVIVNYKANFNYMLMFGNTRRNILYSFFIVYGIMSVILAAVSVASLGLNGTVSAALGGSAAKSSSDLLKLLYKGNINVASEFLWFLMMFIMIAAFSLLYSALSYKLGKVFVSFFWVAFSLSVMLLPVLVGGGRSPALVNFLTGYFCVNDIHGILLAPLKFMLTGALAGGAAWLLARRQKQVV